MTSHPSAICLAGLALAMTTSASLAVAAESIHVGLKDRLDLPEEGYCLDILGWGETIRADLPLFVVNCKDEATPDSSVVYTDQGQLLFPAVEVCVTAFGVNQTVLPGSSVLLRPCDEQTAFFSAAQLQRFDYLENGQLRLRGHEVCLAVSAESAPTFSPLVRWRVLTLESCDDAPLRFSSWQMLPLG